jgi:hypothetical protein
MSASTPILTTPCRCEWCKRYGKQDVLVNTRPLIRSEPHSFFKAIPGRCTRCHYELDKSAAYMVCEKVVCSSGLVPVCDSCVTDNELKYFDQKVTCGGCGRCLSVPAWRTSKKNMLSGLGRQVRTTCNNACFRRALRQRRRPKSLFCKVCTLEFTSTRKDARYCSSACRQSAYRATLRALAATKPAVVQ